MKKLIIGIPGWSFGENNWGVGKHHLDYISQFGTPRILMPDSGMDKDVDILYLPGGLDLSPANYNQPPGFYTSASDPYKEYFYRVNLKQYIDADVPVIGICLGAQMLMIHFGSMLTQNLWYHEQSDDRFKKGHDVYFVNSYNKDKNSFKRGDKYTVNSHHHQGVYLKDLCDEFIPMLAAEDNIVEVAIHKTKPLIACQYHPEEWRDGDAGYMEYLIKDLVDYVQHKGDSNQGTFVEKLFVDKIK